MRSIKQKIALAAGLGLLFTAAALVAYGIYATNNTKNFVSSHCCPAKHPILIG